MKVFGYWYDNELPVFIKNSIKETKKNNPYLEYDIYDNKKSIQFLKNNFDMEVLNAYETLIPKSFKSDLLRFCLLYIYGGLYIDLKLIINSVSKSFFFNDYLLAFGKKKKNYNYKPIETSFLYFKKAGNPNLLKCIKEIVKNVKARDKTGHALLLTGPLLLGKHFQDIVPNMKFTGRRTPTRKFIYKYNKVCLVNNSLEDYYNMESHQSYWTMFKSGKVFYDEVPQEYKIKLFAYWYDNEINDFLKNSIKQTKNNNPYLDYQLYNNTMAREFLKNNFDMEVLKAYDTLIPKSFKSDLLRFALLYIYGGAYIDIKHILNKIPRSIFNKEEYLLAQDRKKKNYKFKPVVTAFLYFKKSGNPRLLKCIKEIVKNVKARDKTGHVLLITGPLLLGKHFQDVVPNIKFISKKSPDKKFIYKYKGFSLIDNSLNDYYSMSSHESYWKLWKRKSVDYVFL